MFREKFGSKKCKSSLTHAVINPTVNVRWNSNKTTERNQKKKQQQLAPQKQKKILKIFRPCKTKVFATVCIVGFCWISKLSIWRSHDLPFWKGILRIDSLREDIMAMEHPRFPFHRKYVFECFMLIDHNVKNIHILAQLQVTWCYKYVNNWLVDSTHGF